MITWACACWLRMARRIVTSAQDLPEPVVPLAHMIATRDRLKALGLSAKSMRRPALGHGVDDDGIIAAGSVLTATLAKPKPKTAGEHEHGAHDHDH